MPVASLTLTRLAHLSISWLLLNWWPHDSLHVYNGHNMGGYWPSNTVFTSR
ncbi:MAG: hypothetical protein HYR94_09405 [Chloroflexi bacterium]|nr:hypothetical protein [Chloroflexota bacterium]